MAIDVKVVKVHPDAKLPTKAEAGSNGYDVYSVEEGSLLSGKRGAFSIGLKIELPQGYVCWVCPRSGMALKMGVTVLNSPGTVDCVPKGTKISTIDGTRNVEDIFADKNKSIILSYNEETNKVEEDVVSDCWMVNDLELLKITTDSGMVEIPKNKELFTKRGWVKACELTLEDEVLNI
jgi:dUTP pyrophosphatase